MTHVSRPSTTGLCGYFFKCLNLYLAHTECLVIEDRQLADRAIYCNTEECSDCARLSDTDWAESRDICVLLGLIIGETYLELNTCKDVFLGGTDFHRTNSELGAYHYLFRLEFL